MPSNGEDDRLPIQSDQQRIGKDAVDAFESCRPRSWIPHSLDGDDDYGLDKQIQIPDKSGRVSCLFFVQIKGSEDDLSDQAKEYFSVTLKIATLNFYARIEDPVMLAFADLSGDIDPRDSPVYWTWITEDIRALLQGKPDFSQFQQKTLTVRVPSANRLTRDFDALEALRSFRRRAAALKDLSHNVKLTAPADRPLEESITSISVAIQRHGAPLMSALTASTDSPWIEPPKGSIRAHLRDAAAAIQENKDVSAAEYLDRIAGQIEPNGTPLERADYEFLRGRILTLRGDQAGAIGHYERAQFLVPDTKYHVAYNEARFVSAYPDDVEKVEEVLQALRETDEEDLVCFRARLLGALEQFEEAEELLKAIDSSQSQTTRALLAYLSKDWDKTIVVCDDGLLREDCKPNQTLLFHMFKARSLFYKSFGDHFDDPSYEISPYGMPDMDFDLAHEAWKEAKETLRLLRDANWPPSAEHIVDVINGLSVTLNRQKEVIVDLGALCRRRPHLRIANEALHRLAAFTEDHRLALEALERLDEDDETIHFKVAILHMMDRHKDVIEFAEKKLISAGRNHKLHGACLAMAAVSAHALVDPERAKPFEGELKGSDRYRGDLAVYSYILENNENPLGRKQAVARLCEDFRANPDSIPIQDNLFSTLSTTDEEHAHLAIDIAEKISQRRRFSLSEIRQLGQAHATLQSWRALISLIDNAIRQYGEIPSLLSIKALAYEGQGDTARALELLETILADDSQDELAINSYLQIAARNGLHAEALDQLETLLQRAKNRSEKASYLRQMFGLQLATSANDARAFEIVQRYGRLSDREDEEEEGLFLQMFLMSTLNELIQVSESQKADFNQRASEYFRRFPNSKIIKSVEIPKEADGEVLLQTLSAAVGSTPELDQWFKRVESQLQRGELAAPFVWRPRRLLRNIPDIAYLWHVAKGSSIDAHAYHLVTVGRDDELKANLTRGTNRTPICDITTLILLTELDILDVALDVLGTIAIGKSTLHEIQNLSHRLLGGYILFQKIAQSLRENIHRIVQPGRLLTPNPNGTDLDKPLEEIKALVAHGTYALYVDDALARQYIGFSVQGVPVITTVDVLVEAERRELLPIREVSRKLAQLIQWRVGVQVQGPFFIAAIPEAVAGTSDLSQLLDVLRTDVTYNRMVNGLWDIRLDYRRILHHWCAQLANAAGSQQAPVELMAALWATWLDKVQFREKPNFDRLAHAATSLVVAATKVNDSEPAIRRLWGAYVLVVQLTYGSEMDEDKEKHARVHAGRVAARIVHNRDDIEFRDRIPQILRSGLVEGTAEDQYFLTGYEEERIELERQTQQER